jgi:multicomponent Na+:H+ antiporter subunit E
VSGTVADEGVAVRLRHQLPLLFWLILVWNLLWGTWSWANLISGVVVALVVTLVLPLPPVVGGVRFRPVALVAFLGTFLVDLVRAGALVAWQTVRPRGISSSAIIRIQLRTDSDLLITIVTAAVTLVPGSMVIEIDREHRLIGLHVLSVDSAEDLEQQRRSVLVTEERVVRAFGTAEEVAALQRAPEPSGRPS